MYYTKKIAAFLTTFLSATAILAQPDVELKFTQPAHHFTESSPLGNGRLGAMVFGNPGKERIVLNEISMWSGGIENPNKEDAYQYFKPIQTLLLEGKNIEAQTLLQQHFICAGKGSGSGNGANVKFGCYQTAGDLWIQWKDSAVPYENYKRSLHIDKAINVTSWQKNGITFTEEVLVSAPQQAIIIRLTASKKGALHFATALSRNERASVQVNKNFMQLTGTLNGGENDNGIHYANALQVIPVGGQIISKNNVITIDGATACLLIITAGTDLNWPTVEQRGTNPLPKVLRQNQLAARLSWKQMEQNHVKDYQSYFNRCRLWLNDTKPNDNSLQQRLQLVKDGNDDASLISLYFNFGRYLLISSSRPGGMPANLQGLWAEEYQTPWNGDYHIDINLQMNYWLADPTNLSDCQKPLYQLLQQMANYGKRTAKAYYNADGWVAHVIYNPWGFTAPGEGAEWGSTLTGGAWLATHLIQHYQFNPDKKFLEQYYPILKGASQFFKGILIHEPKHNWLVTAPSNSPENAYKLPDGQTGNTCMGPTMDMQIGRELLLGTAHAAKILGVDKLWADSLIRIAGELAPNQISVRTGAIQEWLEDYEETDPHHRHTSLLYGLHPYDEITPWDSPELAEAARKTLQRRGDEGTGWSRAWKIYFWARLGDGNHAYKMLKALLEPVGASSEIQMTSGAGTYPNLFDAHPPFQIDGNFGATAAISEFFVQSHGKNEVIRLLPALPDAPAFQKGSIKGMRARNGFEINFDWQDGKVKNLSIKSSYGKSCKIVLPEKVLVKDKSGKIIPATFGNGVLNFNTKAGESYILKF
ncbi:MAG: alpha-L-fucosidase [Chitinophagaceae bacterium]|nr:alpha-L-fucosidase [Chitinophagaceae bacterium]